MPENIQDMLREDMEFTGGYTYRTPEQAYQSRKADYEKEHEDDFSLGDQADITTGSFKWNTILGAQVRREQAAAIDDTPQEDYDPAVTYGADEVAKHYESPELKAELMKTVNDKQYNHIVEEHQNEIDFNKLMHKQGFIGWGNNILTSLFADPLTYGGFSSLTKITTNSRLAKAGLGALAAGAETALTEGVLVNQSTNRSWGEAGYLIAGSMALGGSVMAAFPGKLAKGGADDVIKTNVDKIQKNMDTELAGGVVDEAADGVEAFTKAAHRQNAPGNRVMDTPESVAEEAAVRKVNMEIDRASTLAINQELMDRATKRNRTKLLFKEKDDARAAFAASEKGKKATEGTPYDNAIADAQQRILDITVHENRIKKQLKAAKKKARKTKGKHTPEEQTALKQEAKGLQETFDELKAERKATADLLDKQYHPGATPLTKAEIGYPTKGVGADVAGEVHVNRNADPEAMSMWHQTLFAQNSRSKSDTAKEINLSMNENAAGWGGRKAPEDTAAVLSDRLKNEFSDKFVPGYERAYNKFLKSKDMLFIKAKALDFRSPQFETNFSKLVQRGLNDIAVGRKIDLGNITEDAKKAVMEAIDSQETTSKLLWDKQFAAKIIDGEYRPGYYARHWQSDTFIQMQDQFDIPSLLVKGLKGANPNITDELANKIAKALNNRFTKMPTGTTYKNHVTHDAMSFIDEVLEESGSLDKDTIADLIELFKLKNLEEGKGRPDYSKRRIQLDMNAEVADGMGNVLSLSDLVSSNIKRNTVRQIRDVSGRLSLAPAKLSSRAEWDAKMTQIMKEHIEGWKSLGFENVSSARVAAEKDIERLGLGRKQILGQPLYDNPGSGEAKFVNTVRDLGNVQLLQRMGLAQLSEVQQVIAQGGVMNFIKEVPFSRRLYKRTLDGTLEDGFLADCESLVGYRIGDDVHRNPAILRDEAQGLNIAGNDMASSGGTYMYEKLMHNLKTTVGILSGHHAIMRWSQKVQHRLLAKKLGRIILGGEPDAATWKRLMEIGIDEDAFDLLQKEAKHIDLNKGLGVNNWAPEAREKMAIALHRGNGLAIQKQFAGETYAFSSGLWGGALSQFRMFPLTAIEKQGFRAIKMHDQEAFISGTFGLGMSLSVYMAKVQMNAATMERSKRRAYREEMMKPSNLTLGAFQLVGHLGMGSEFITAIANLYGIGGDPSGRYGTFGSSSNLMELIPGVGMMNDMGAAVTSGIRSIATGTIDKQAVRDWERMIPLTRTTAGAVASMAYNKVTGE